MQCFFNLLRLRQFFRYQCLGGLLAPLSISFRLNLQRLSFRHHQIKFLLLATFPGQQNFT